MFTNSCLINKQGMFKRKKIAKVYPGKEDHFDFFFFAFSLVCFDTETTGGYEISGYREFQYLMPLKLRLIQSYFMFKARRRAKVNLY